MQAAANAIHARGTVVWVGTFSHLHIRQLYLNNTLTLVLSDTSAAIVGPRFEEILVAVAEPDGLTDELARFHHYTTPTLTHLLALLLHPPSTFPPVDSSLLVIDGLHTILDMAYPRYSSTRNTKTEAAKWSAGRRYSVLGALMGAMKKMAAIRDVAVIVTTGCVTRVRPGSGLGAVLVSGVGGAEWDNGITNRLLLFRDTHRPLPEVESQNGKQDYKPRCARFVAVQKLGGQVLVEEGETGHILQFLITKVRS